MYLDNVDFRQCQVKPDMPRISIWKDNMIQLYSELDKEGPGEYGIYLFLIMSPHAVGAECGPDTKQ
jgi:hypothetical protein